MTQEELKKRLELHAEFIFSEGKKGVFLNLAGADLSKMDLRRAYLYEVNLEGANLEGVNLRGANISKARLCRANLRGANLCDATIRDADIFAADLSGASLSNSILCGSNLGYSNLKDTDLMNAVITEVNLIGATNVPFIPYNIPDGEFIAWKKVEGMIIKIKILEDSKRSRATSNKCRCDKALVLEIQNLRGEQSNLQEITNNVYKPTTYKIGEVVYADKWHDNRWYECTHGIHFFMDRESAVKF